MTEKTDEEVIAEVAQELIDGINKQETRKEEHKVCDVDTLCDWGLLGMLTARDIATAFVGKALYSVRQAERKKHEDHITNRIKIIERGCGKKFVHWLEKEEVHIQTYCGAPRIKATILCPVCEGKRDLLLLIRNTVR